MNLLRSHFKLKNSGADYRTLWQCLHLDLPLLLLLIILTAVGFFILYSVSGQNSHLVVKQAWHISLAYLLMILLAQVPPHTYERYASVIYGVGVLLLFYVLIAGHIGLGARRWINLASIHFQPSELLKIAIPMLLASRFSNQHLPPRNKELGICALLIFIPFILTLKQPDLGTAILLMIAGISTLFLAGMRLRIFVILFLLIIICAPLFWHFMHDYQRLRVLTFIHPERDPLGAGYHIIQSKIAIGTGGLTGLGYLNVPQAQLHFLPEHTTDFIFAVFMQQFGILGAALLLLIFLCIIARCFIITMRAQTTFSRLLAGSLSLTFFMSVFINMAMVCGLLPVVGLPLPLVSYGGTAMVTMLANFGILMSIHKHRTLLSK